MGDLRSRSFAVLYDRAFAMSERSGLRARRKSLLGPAVGRVLELGAGTGLNADRFPRGLAQLILTDPDRHMMDKLERRVESFPFPVQLMRTAASSLPVEDGSIDTVVGTFLLCTVPDPEVALREVARVLVPGGQFLFMEHVRSASLTLRICQDCLRRPWSWLACGCQCNRRTLDTLRASPLTLEWSGTGRLKWLTPLLRPLVMGRAVKPMSHPSAGDAKATGPMGQELLSPDLTTP